MSKAQDVLNALAGNVGAGNPTVTPSIPNVPAIGDANLRQFLSALKQIIETREGERGDALDSSVTWRDLIEKKFATIDATKGGQPIDGLGPAATPGGGGAAIDYTKPPVPANLVVTGALATIILDWDTPDYKNHAYTEIWRSSINNIGTAEMVGMAPGAVYADSVGGGHAYYYWIRFVSTAAVVGDYNQTEGTPGQTSLDPDYLMDALASEYGSAPFFTVTEPIIIDGVTIPPGVYIKQAVIADGTISRAKIGNAAIDSAKIADAAIVNAKIADASITTAKIGDAQITNAKIANLDAGKINAGFISADRINANSVTADKIDSRNLTIKDAAGNIVFSAANNLDWSRISGTGKAADNATVGATFGVNIGGQITGANASTYIADAAIQTAQIANAAIGSAKIADGAITNAKIGDAQITAAKIASLALVGANNFDVKTGYSGARMEMNNQVIKVFDASGVLRVKLGNLDA